MPNPAEYGFLGTTALKLDIGTEFSSLGPGLADLYGPLGDTVGKLVGQYSDSDRVSPSLQTPSRESKKLKICNFRDERERESGWKAFVRGEDRLSIREPRCKIGSIFTSHSGGPELRRGGGGLTHH